MEVKNPKIKICGLTRPEDIEAANQLLPDYIGFVFWKKSKRNVEPEQAKLLKDMLDSRIKAVGVFLDADIRIGSCAVCSYGERIKTYGYDADIRKTRIACFR